VRDPLAIYLLLTTLARSRIERGHIGAVVIGSHAAEHSLVDAAESGHDNLARQVRDIRPGTVGYDIASSAVRNREIQSAAVSRGGLYMNSMRMPLSSSTKDA
jgi:hypothetical protein